MGKKIATIYLLALFTGSIWAQDLSLPEPDKSGGNPLMQALNQRQSTRAFSSESLTDQQLSNLLWACAGYNRADQKKRTAPSSRNMQEIDVYVALQSGLYIYSPEFHSLKQVHNRDIRSLTGTQDFIAEADLNIVYVADMSKLGKKEGDTIREADLLSSWANTGFMAQNVYLYCASDNLGCVVRGLVPKETLILAMGLRSNQAIILAQTVGVPLK
jgi:nitroreductase